MERFLVLFIDGIGIGEAAPHNPFHTEPNEFFRDLRQEEVVDVPYGGAARGLDATLGVPGIPQSATGQTSLFTGINAQAHIGRHLSGGPSAELKAVLHQGNLLKATAERGLPATFANAYLDDFFTLEYRRRDSVTTTMMRASGLSFHPIRHILEGKAIYHEFTHRFLQSLGYDIPTFTPEQSGRQLAAIAMSHAVTVYEYFMSDMVGHSLDEAQGREEVRKINAFLHGLLESVDRDAVTIILASDHGNLEHIAKKEHTLNPVPGMVWGPHRDAAIEALERIDQVTPFIVERLGWSFEPQMDTDEHG